MTANRVLVPRARIPRWFDNFAQRHGVPTVETDQGRLVATAEDSALAEAVLPFSRSYDGPPDVAAFANEAAAEVRWGILLVRKGGFAVAMGTTDAALLSKVGQRHVQGRTKAGGQSQQRFSRRRDNQARQAYEAAADHAYRILIAGSGGLDALVCGGDRSAVEAVLEDPRLQRLAQLRCEPWLPVPDPKRGVLERAIADAWSVAITITDP